MSLHPAGCLEEEADYFGACIRPGGIGERAARIAPRPGVAETRDAPLLHLDASICIDGHGAPDGSPAHDQRFVPLVGHRSTSRVCLARHGGGI